jgi:hypothetical protein
MSDLDPEILIEEGPAGPQERKYTVAQRVGLRFLALFALLFFALWSAIALLATLIALLFFGITLGRTREFLSIAKKYWSAFCFTCAAMAGALIALFSVRFGIGVILIYLLLHADEQTGGQFIGSLRGQFQSAFHRF